MVLVGHSMGGLICELQTFNSGDAYWNIMSDQPFQLVKSTPETLRGLQNTFFFRPNPSVRRVVTIGTPHRGSNFSNSTTQWLSEKFITLPSMLVRSKEQLEKDNPGLFARSELIRVRTSIDSLAPDSPILPVMLSTPRPPWVTYHNIVGRIPEEGFLGRVVGGSDGVVAFTSAHLDNVASEVVVNADHVEINRHPLTALELQRILLDHLAHLPHPSAPRPYAPMQPLPWTAAVTPQPPYPAAPAGQPARVQ
jgi:hypothetical protein